MPCQAADLLAYVHRQNISTIYDNGINHCRILDIIVGRKGLLVGALEPLRTMSDSDFYELVQDMRKTKKKFEEQRQGLGSKKPIFYPAKEHPYIRELHRKWTAFQMFK